MKLSMSAGNVIRVRHYTRNSSAERILREGIINACDQNKVFVEKTIRNPLSPKDAERKYGLARGKARAYIEFDVTVDELRYQLNYHIPSGGEFYLIGDIDLTGRNPKCFIR
ncbi:hypothetical protein FJZ31_12390 [Candidatus Poribacteria bacterium]|nr:hypothetical protein [Candidatus Poribacteria bacterium]